jgi:hypothetical protein
VGKSEGKRSLRKSSSRWKDSIVTYSGTGDAVRIVTSFYYDFTSRHYNFFLQCALCTSVLILYLGWSSDCWLLGYYLSSTSHTNQTALLEKRHQLLLSFQLTTQYVPLT